MALFLAKCQDGKHEAKGHDGRARWEESERGDVVLWRADAVENWTLLMSRLLYLTRPRATECKSQQRPSRVLIMYCGPAADRSRFKKACRAWLRLTTRVPVVWLSSKLRTVPEYALALYKASTLVTRDACVNATGSAEEKHQTLERIMGPLFFILDARFSGCTVVLSDGCENKRSESEATLAEKLYAVLWPGERPPTVESFPADDEKLLMASPVSLQFDAGLAALSELQAQVRRLFCQPGDTKTNPVFDICRRCIFPFLQRRLRANTDQKAVSDHGVSLTFWRPAKFGGPMTVSSVQELQQAIESNRLTPPDLKDAVLDFLTFRLFDIQRTKSPK